MQSSMHSAFASSPHAVIDVGVRGLFGVARGISHRAWLERGSLKSLLSPHKKTGDVGVKGGGGGRAAGGQGRRTRLEASKGEDEAAKRGGRKGFYVRPSKAVELGGGFYVPGLEGTRLRMALSAFAIAMLLVNRAILPGFVPQQSQNISEVITAATTLMLLGQALYETFGGGNDREVDNEEDTAAPKAASRPQSSARLGGEATDNELWLVASALQVFSPHSSPHPSSRLSPPACHPRRICTRLPDPQIPRRRAPRIPSRIFENSISDFVVQLPSCAPVVLSDRLPPAVPPQVLPRSSAALTLDPQGCLAIYAPSMCTDEAGAAAYQACSTLLKGGRAASVDRGDKGSEALFGVLPSSCKQAFVCGEGGEGGEGGRKLVVGMPSGVREVSEVEAKWLASLATLPRP